MRYKSSDGLVSSSDPNVVAQWDAIGARMEAEKMSWTDALREMGVKLAHPDDGWVHPTLPRAERGDGYLSLSWYPQFNDQPKEGDLIALGAPHSLPYRLCRVTKVERGSSLIDWTHVHYEDTGQRVPAPAPRRRWWQRRP